MKNKIAGKLLIYFASALLLLSIIIGGVFSILFNHKTTEFHKQELEARAINIADTLGGFLDGHVMRPGFGGLGAYMNFLDQIAMSDVWVVDTKSQLITRGMGHNNVKYSELPKDGTEVINKALTGTISFSEGFSELLGVKSITVGAPILKQDGTVLGVVLLHSPVSSSVNIVFDGIKILISSVLIALLLAVPATYLLSLRFTKPLNRMKNTAVLLAQGDYTAKNQIDQKDEIGELADAMDTMADRLLDASNESHRLEKMRQEFTANVSHELRTPVTVLRGSLEAICDEVVSEPHQVEEYHRQMLAESIHLERLVNDLLELSRLQNVDFKTEKYPLNLRDLSNDVARSMGRVAAKKQITIDIKNNITEILILGDYARLRQMLLIIMDNAIKFSKEGGTVSLELFEKDGLGVIAIGDEGPGIPEEELPYIFDRFHKATNEQNKAGTGLGLAIAKQIAERHNVIIKVDNNQPSGAVFTFIFSSHE